MRVIPTHQSKRCGHSKIILSILAASLLLLAFPAPTAHAETPQELLAGNVIINEIYYTIPQNVSFENRTQWVELYNPTDTDIDISEWHVNFLYHSVSVAIPQGTVLKSGKFLILSNNLTGLQSTWEVPADADTLEFSSLAAHENDTIALFNTTGMQWPTVDRVVYGNIGLNPTARDGNSLARYRHGYLEGISIADFYEEPRPTPGLENNFEKDALEIYLSSYRYQSQLFMGQSLQFTLRLKNSGDTAMSIMEPEFIRNSISFEVLGPDGQTRFLVGRDYWDALGLEMMAGESEWRYFDLNDGLPSETAFGEVNKSIDVFPVAGEYWITAHYVSDGPLPEVTWFGQISSEAINITVLEDPTTNLKFEATAQKQEYLSGEPIVIDTVFRSNFSLPAELYPLETEQLELECWRDDLKLHLAFLDGASSAESRTIDNEGILESRILLEDNAADINWSIPGNYSVVLSYRNGWWDPPVDSEPVNFTVVDFVDLSLDDYSIRLSNPSPLEGETITVFVDVQNNGTLPSSTSVTLYTGDDTGPAALLSKRIVSVSTKSRANAEFEWEVFEGDQTLWAILDNVPYDSNLTNHQASFRLYVGLPPSGPDLFITPSDISFSDMTPDVGDVVTVFVSIHNNGDIAAPALLRLYDGVPSQGGIRIGEGVRVIVPARSGYLTSIDWTATPGNHTLTVFISLAEGDLVELTEVNNQVHAFISVGSSLLPRLVLSPVDVPPEEVVHGSSITFTLEIRSFMTYANSVQIESLEMSGLELSSVPSSQDISPGETITFVVTLNSPEDTILGVKLPVVLKAVGVGASSNIWASSFRIVEKPRSEDTRFLATPMGVASAASAVGMVSVLSIIGLGTEFGRYRLFALLLLPLFTRIGKEEIFDNFTRGKIYGSISTYPGIHYTSLKQILELNSGTVTYHIKILEREGYIKSVRDGRYLCLYPARKSLPKSQARRIQSLKIPERMADPASRIQLRIAGTIREHPGISQKEIARILEESKQLVSYHVKLLADAGVCRIERKGRQSACYFIERRRVICPRCRAESEVRVPGNAADAKCPKCGVAGVLGSGV